jgi:hypothetical protein
LRAMTASRPEGRRAWMPAVFRPSHGWRVGKSWGSIRHGIAVSRKAFFFGSFLLTLIKRNELAPKGRNAFALRDNDPKTKRHHTDITKNLPHVITP